MGIRGRGGRPRLSIKMRNLFIGALLIQVVVLGLYVSMHNWSERGDDESLSEGGKTRHQRVPDRHRDADPVRDKGEIVAQEDGVERPATNGNPAPSAEAVERDGSAKVSADAIARLEGEEAQSGRKQWGDSTSACVWERPGEYDGAERLSFVSKTGSGDYLLVGSCGQGKLHVAYVANSASGWIPSTDDAPPRPRPFPANTLGGGAMETVRRGADPKGRTWRYLRGAVRYGAVERCAKPVQVIRSDPAEDEEAPCATSASHTAVAAAPGVFIVTFDLPMSHPRAHSGDEGAWVSVSRGYAGCERRLEEGRGTCEPLEGMMHSQVGDVILKHAVQNWGGGGADGGVSKCDRTVNHGFWEAGGTWVHSPSCDESEVSVERKDDMQVFSFFSASGD